MATNGHPRETALLAGRGDTQQALLQVLLHSEGGMSVDALVEKLEVTANAVRQHLAALELDRLVTYDVRPAPRGRPQHVYRLTERGQEAFPRRYRELAEVLIQELAAHLPGDALGAAMKRMGKRAAQAVGPEPVNARGAARLLEQLGYEATASGTREIVAKNCVFHQLAKEVPAVCQFDLGFLEAATGRKIEHRECMVRGGACCRFRLAGAR